MLKRSIFLGLLAGALLQGFSVKAEAATRLHTANVLGVLKAAVSAHANVAANLSGVTDVRWVCGPYRCAWIPNYRGKVVVYPHMRVWVRPPSPHCYYERGFFGRWKLICP